MAKSSTHSPKSPMKTRAKKNASGKLGKEKAQHTTSLSASESLETKRINEQKEGVPSTESGISQYSDLPKLLNFITRLQQETVEFMRDIKTVLNAMNEQNVQNHASVSQSLQQLSNRADIVEERIEKVSSNLNQLQTTMSPATQVSLSENVAKACEEKNKQISEYILHEKRQKAIQEKKLRQLYILTSFQQQIGIWQSVNLSCHYLNFPIVYNIK